MTAILAAKAAKGIYSALKDNGAGTDPAPTVEKAWTLLSPFQRVEWMKMSGSEINIIYCANDWLKLPVEHRVRLCGSMLSMVELFARIGSAKEANGKVPKAELPGNGSDLQPGSPDVRSGAVAGDKPVPS